MGSLSCAYQSPTPVWPTKGPVTLFFWPAVSRTRQTAIWAAMFLQVLRHIKLTLCHSPTLEEAKQRAHSEA